MSETNDTLEWLAEHPKMMGALWALALLLAETGSVAADGIGAKAGP